MAMGAPMVTVGSMMGTLRFKLSRSPTVVVGGICCCVSDGCVDGCCCDDGIGICTWGVVDCICCTCCVDGGGGGIIVPVD